MMTSAPERSQKSNRCFALESGRNEEHFLRGKRSTVRAGYHSIVSKMWRLASGSHKAFPCRDGMEIVPSGL
jgi:hypothetical protein